MRELALFAGAGGGILGGKLLGWRTVCAVEIDPFCRRVLLARQRDGILPRFPIWDDVQTFDGKPWRGHVDVISGGFPCQDISKLYTGEGLEGSRSGLWEDMARIVGEVRPSYVFVENSPVLTSRGLGTVLGDLALLGYDARWGVLGAYEAGAPHKRHRIWIVAHSNAECDRLAGKQQTRTASGPIHRPSDGSHSAWRSAESGMRRVVDGLAHRVDRLRAIGNGQVPAVAAIAWEELKPAQD